MSTCARCGLPKGPASEQCAADYDDKYNPGDNRVACRDRELMNLRSLLRSVTGKLERALDLLDFDASGYSLAQGRAEIESVLELLS